MESSASPQLGAPRKVPAVSRRKRAVAPEIPPEFTASEAGFHAWTDGSLLHMIEDCHVMRVGVMNDAASFVDFMRTAYPYESHWSEITPDQVSKAIRRIARSAIRVVDEVIFPPPMPESERLSSPPTYGTATPTEEARSALFEMRDAMEILLKDILLRPRRRPSPIDALVIPGSVDNLNYDLASPAEALFLVRNVYLAQFNQRARQWAARDDDWARAAYLIVNPTMRFDSVDEMRAYDAKRTKGEEELRTFTLTTAWAHECRLWHAVHFDDADPDTLVRASPNLFLTDRSTPSTEEVSGVEEFFKRMHWALPGHLPPEYGDEGPKGEGHRLTLGHCLLGGVGFIPTVLAAAAAGDLPWAIRVPLSRARTTVPGLRSVSLNAIEDKSEAEVRLALGLAKWLDSPPPSESMPPLHGQTLLTQTLRSELDRISELLLKVEDPPLRDSGEVAAREVETGEHGPAASDLNLRHYLRRLRPNSTTPMSAEEMLPKLLGLITHVAALEALGGLAAASARLRELDREAIRAMLIALLTNDMLKTILGRLADPAGASELSSLDAYALSGGREAQLVSTAYFSFLAKSEARIPEWLLRGMREMRRAVASGNYGPIDDWMADDGGEPTHLPGIRLVTIAMDTVSLMSRFGLYAHLLEQYHHDWRNATAPAAKRDDSGIYNTFLKFGRVAIGLGRDYANAPTVEQTDDFFSHTRLYDLDVVPSVYRALGHFTVGIAAFAHLFVLCGVPFDMAYKADVKRLERHCVSAALYGGIRSTRVLEIWREGDKYAKILGSSLYPALGPGPAIQVIQLLNTLPDNWRRRWADRKHPHPRAVTEWLMRLKHWIQDRTLITEAMADEEMARDGPFHRLFTSMLRELPVWDHENALAFKHYMRHVLLSERSV